MFLYQLCCGELLCPALLKKPVCKLATNVPWHACSARQPASKRPIPNRWRVASRWTWSAPPSANSPPRRLPGAANICRPSAHYVRKHAADAQQSAVSTTWIIASVAPKRASVAQLPALPWLADHPGNRSICRFSISGTAIGPVPLASFWLDSASVQAQTATAMATSAVMAMGQMHKGAAESYDTKAPVMMGTDGVQKMMRSGETDKDFETMMKPDVEWVAFRSTPTRNEPYRRLFEALRTGPAFALFASKREQVVRRSAPL